MSASRQTCPDKQVYFQVRVKHFVKDSSLRRKIESKCKIDVCIDRICLEPCRPAEMAAAIAIKAFAALIVQRIVRSTCQVAADESSSSFRYSPLSVASAAHLPPGFRRGYDEEQKFDILSGSVYPPTFALQASQA